MGTSISSAQNGESSKLDQWSVQITLSVLCLSPTLVFELLAIILALNLYIM